MCERLFSGDLGRMLCSGDFNRGYLTGAGLVLGLLVLFVIIRLILKIIFRCRRCGQIVVSASSGDLVISRAVIEQTVRKVLRGVNELDVSRIRLFRTGKNYSLQLYCTFFGGGRGVPEIAGDIRVRIGETLQKLFGITMLKRIDLRVEEQAESVAMPEVCSPAPAAAAKEGDTSDADSGI